MRTVPQDSSISRTATAGEGTGERRAAVVGTRQAGAPELRVANLLRDRPLLELARTEACRFAEGPEAAVAREEIEAVWARLKEQWQRRYGLIEA